MSKDLSPLWISENLKDARRSYNAALNAYNSLFNKNTQYACGILRIINIRENIVALWDAAAKECDREHIHPESQPQPPSQP
jgi:hypothetical protein